TLPSVAGQAHRRIYLDNPGGTQVAQPVIDRMNHYLVHNNANHGGAFRTSVDSDAVLHDAHAAMADLLNAASADEIIFGPNMTTLTFSISRALGRWLKPGDEIVVTRLDHDANITPWTMMAEDRGAVVRWVDIREEDCTLDMADFESQINERTKIVACGYASNAVGTINDVKTVVDMAHAAGALVFVDAVQYVPHGPTDVQALGCDFLACSAYKFFGPHTGIVYGKHDLLDRLTAYKVRPADNNPPYKFETGTQNHEGIAGTLGAVEYIAWLGEQFGSEYAGQFGGMTGRRLHAHCGMAAMAAYERQISEWLITGLSQISGLRIWGITELKRLDRRVPTVSFTLKGWRPRDAAEKLAEQNIFVWDGNYYALAIMERLDLQQHGGMVRVGAAHYNTVEEIDQLIEAVRGLKK
ncbi:MAG TPA: cysteine desulfurase-like protein, partial [Anaerolineales bacterium]|nr:cysteine desulfurase-like protein [Anaerolineales bacterium]